MSNTENGNDGAVAVALNVGTPVMEHEQESAVVRSTKMFRPGTLARAVFQAGVRRPVMKSTLIDVVSKKTGKSAKCVEFVIRWMAHKEHTTNRMRVQNLLGNQTEKIHWEWIGG